MMLTINRKDDQARGSKAKLDFDNILEQILNLDTQKKVSKSRSMKSASKATETKKPIGHSHLSYPYYSKSGHIKEICYYKHLQQAKQSFQERFKDRIADLKSKNEGLIRTIYDQDHPLPDIKSRDWMVRQLLLFALSTETYNTSWYFENAVFYHISYDLKDFEDPTHLQPCILLQDDITFAD